MHGKGKHGVALLLVLLACGASAEPEADTAPNPATENLGRTCVALAVFTAARGASWLEQATVAQTVINAAGEPALACDVLPDLLGHTPPFPRPSSPHLLDWLTAQAVADAVLLGDFVVSPPLCAAATRFFRAVEGPARALSPQVCRVGSLDFFSEPRALAPEAIASAPAVTH
jgi:hypothetical protein